MAGTASDTDKKEYRIRKTKGWQPTTTEAKEEEVPVQSTSDKIFESMSNLGNY